MIVKTTREIVKIDEDKCNGCGLCVPACAEGAIRIIDGKARLVADNLCDGLGDCLGTCPQGAIAIERRDAEAFDEAAVEAHRGRAEAADETHPDGAKAQRVSGKGLGGDAPRGCPGAMLRKLRTPQGRPAGGCPSGTVRTLSPARGEQPAAPTKPPSRLQQWPVQLALLPVGGEIWQDADVLIAADCVAAAMPDFHQRLLAGKTLAVACPKLDDVQPYVEKLTRIFADNAVRSVTVAHMEVPCCTGILLAVQTALERAGRDDLEVRGVVVGIDGRIQRGATQ